MLALAATFLTMLGVGFWLASDMHDHDTTIASSADPVQGIVTASLGSEASFEVKAG
tara:strand:- start:25005 stop:25172 length:168 start_codon:yes stop_codon:yes gene_type:complete